MINFFRKIRKKNLTNNKFSKYLIYAIGEIFLVVLGIVIALQINNWNENKKAFNKTELLLKQVQKELATNIKNANIVIEFYREINPYFYKVINKNVTAKDYKEDVVLSLILQGVETVDLTNDTFLNLLDNSGELSKEQDSIIAKLNQLYKKDKKVIDILDKKVIEDLFKFTNELSDTKIWYGDFAKSYIINEEVVAYFLEDPFYYNKIINFELINLKGHLKSVIEFRNKSLLIYYQLSNYLNMEKDDIIYKNLANFEHYLGKYQMENQENIIVEIAKNSSETYFSLKVTNLNDSDFLQTSTIYPDTKANFITASNFGTLIFDEQDLVSKLILEVGSTRQTFVRIKE